MSWTERIEEAEAHERMAETHAEIGAIAETRSPEYACTFDHVLNDQMTSNDERVTSWLPCEEIGYRTSSHQRELAQAQRVEAREHRAIAGRMAKLEQTWCRGMSKDEIAYNVFADPDAVDKVIPQGSGNELRGVRIVFKPGIGPSAGSARRSIGCQIARWVMSGRSPTFRMEDPTLVDGAKVTVTEDDGRLDILVMTNSPEGRAIALGRAQDLKTSQTARRSTPATQTPGA